jgi:N-acetylglutamate synthase-like GNAT family acetyltransferase
VSAWKLPDAVPGERFDLESTGDGFSIVRKRDQARVGAVVLDREETRTTIRSLCVDEAHRSYGAGSEAARLFTGAADADGVPLLRAWAHPNLGLSVYFWIRMGFSPLHGEGPEGGIWFERRGDAYP